ncbi:uncharacterized protein LOC123537519 isoform X1 [Mercenaria mercenaria]|uniref:uncharacterized protein LOC123537519 isoform X1 n=1 Tax=Mercenaria mercenaria TaxID=6596 RepID=UPI00234E6D8F|nr:uncharacterized protein LOC123537519 isoform X1 [Mercenaria mercenaria]
MNTEKDKERLRDKVNEQNVEIQRLRPEIKKKTSELLALSEEMEIIKKECDEKKSENIMLANQYEAKNNELIQIMSKKTIQVQLYGQRSMGWTSEIEKELIDSLKTEMKSVDDKLELSFFKVSRPSDVLPDIPLLLICVTISRLGTDVINATQGLALAPNMALTIFHHKDEHALPNQASERILMAKELRGAGGIFDMAFKSDMGIYSCDMNINTISSLITFIRRQAT